MLVFGIDVPLVELIFAMTLIIFVLLLETLVIVFLMMKQSSKMKKLTELVDSLSQTILAIKKSEMEHLDRLKKK